jgi:hypothetical protein
MFRSAKNTKRAREAPVEVREPIMKRKRMHKHEVELNTIDPIMLEPVKPNPFLFQRPNGTYVAFNIDSLVDYLLVTGDFTDPETRLPFSDSDLRSIDLFAKKVGFNKKSVYEAKHSIGQYDDMKFRRDALLG